MPADLPLDEALQVRPVVLCDPAPPDEEVGLTPYGTPGFDAALSDPGYRQPAPVASGPVDLGLPGLRPPLPSPSRRGA